MDERCKNCFGDRRAECDDIRARQVNALANNAAINVATELSRIGCIKPYVSEGELTPPQTAALPEQAEPS